MRKKGCFWNPATYSCQNGKYVGRVIHNLVVIICDKVIDTTKLPSTKTISTKTISNKCVLTNFYVLVSFLIIAIAFLIAISIYLIKH